MCIPYHMHCKAKLSPPVLITNEEFMVLEEHRHG